MLILVISLSALVFDIKFNSISSLADVLILAELF